MLVVIIWIMLVTSYNFFYLFLGSGGLVSFGTY
jgi:hypothetical protein